MSHLGVRLIFEAQRDRDSLYHRLWHHLWAMGKRREPVEDIRKRMRETA